MTEGMSDERLRRLQQDVLRGVDRLTDQDALDVFNAFNELFALRAENKQMRARCTWLQGRRKALQAIAAKRMVRMRTLRRMRAQLAAGHNDYGISMTRRVE